MNRTSALVWHSGEAYDIGQCDGTWWFQRRDGYGGWETNDWLGRQFAADSRRLEIAITGLRAASAKRRQASDAKKG